MCHYWRELSDLAWVGGRLAQCSISRRLRSNHFHVSSQELGRFDMARDHLTYEEFEAGLTGGTLLLCQNSNG